jgi:transcription-repair coupling factor (superfamily II helicase)
MHYKVKLDNISNKTDIIKINDDAISYALCELIKSSNKKVFLHVVQNDARASQIKQQVKLLNPNLNILSFPAWDCLPYDNSSPKSTIIASRIETLSYLSKEVLAKTLIITTINSILQKTIPLQNIKESGFLLKIGDEISLDQLAEILVKNGYQRSPSADNIGEYAIRGSIVDVIIKNKQTDEEVGYRLDFFGNNLESIRIFDPLTQISSKKVNQIGFLPSREITLNEQTISNFKNNYRNLFGVNKNDSTYEGIMLGRYISGIEHFMPLFYKNQLSNIFDYLENQDYLIGLENSSNSQRQERLKEVKQYYQARTDTLKESILEGSIYNPVEPGQLYLNNDTLEENLNKNLLVRFDNFESQYFNRVIDLGFKPTPDFVLASKSNNKSPFDLMKEFIKSFSLTKQKIFIACSSQGSASRLEKILLNHEIASKTIQNISDAKDLEKNVIALITMPIQSGFYCEDLTIISESSLIGAKKIIKKNRKLSIGLIGESLGIGLKELVVHRYHGIGCFEGLQNITAGNITNDFLKITYLGGDNLFLPVEDINLITRYGSENPLMQLDKLGGSAWKNRSGKIKKRIKIAAEELIKIAALRTSKKAPILIAKTGDYEEFKAKFEFVETLDQLSAIEEIEEDLSKGSPMDRLICGDVGFGKTEVAMRAAFIATKNETNPYQVAIVTPTTLLCRQHYNNFLTRFKGSGLKIAQLSRMITPSKARQVKLDLENGKIDIVIGTHALLHKNIKFKNLGLVVIDEEQHFGVGQKERLKEFRNEIHILTLSATPIPRTLQMSLSGVKDLSLIATPPIDRIAIRSFVMDYDSVIIKEAIMREFHRGGKIFFVVPRIKDLEEIHPKLEKLVPDIKISTAHGQMPPSKLDEIMNDFYDDKFQLLLSTTIIESGIDIKDANTIIIHRSHMFGLSQLYQLRGRVGRGKIRAYAYLTTPPRRKLTADATKKLQVMQTLDSLGAGFSIASHDMDIRGSGNILGDEQSGHVRETGVELYQEMLNEAINELKYNDEQKISENIDNYQSQIKLKISLLISEEYINELGLRLSFYNRISRIKSIEDKENLEIEIVDRFGKLPQEVNNLLEISYLKHLCQQCNIEKIEAKTGGILITFRNNHFSNPDELLALVFSKNSKLKLQTHQLLFLGATRSPEDKLKSSFEIVNKLSQIKMIN